jgi:uncharacterized protein YfaT (DUF1175 family)
MATRSVIARQTEPPLSITPVRTDLIRMHSCQRIPVVGSFLNVLVNTQAFINFIDERIQPENANAADIVFFDQSIDAKHNRLSVAVVQVCHSLPGLE